MTQKEIAKQLNISQATVSMALKGSERISPAVREAVRRLAADIGYRPNPAGQMLRLGRSNVIGAVFPSLTNSYYAELFQELQCGLEPHGYLLYFIPAGSHAEAASAAASLQSMRVAGVVALGMFAEQLLPLRDDGIALVFYGGEQLISEQVSQVLPDRFGAGRKLTDFLIRRGRKHIAFLGAQGKEEQRYRGYCAALAAAGMEARPMPVPPACDLLTAGYEGMRQLLLRHPDTDGVFAHNDDMAIGALRAAAEAGIQVPEALSLAGFDNITAGRYTSPALTSVEQPRGEIARLLVEELCAVLRDFHHARFVSVPCRLTIRESA